MMSDQSDNIRASKTIVFYDHSCNMCVGLTGWISKLDDKKQFELVPYQDAVYLRQYPQLDPLKMEKQIHVITEKKKILAGADAMLEIWRKIGHFTSPLAYLLRIPPFIWLARPLYNLIAKYRKDIFPNRF